VQATLLRGFDRAVAVAATRGAFLAYLRTAIMNYVRDEIRRSLRRPEESLPDTHAACADTRQPLAQVEHAGDCARLLAHVPPRHRALLVRRYGEERTYADIARETNRSEDAVRVTIVRIVQALARKVDAEAVAVP
jgi:RNA polymerase sigma factor (sigma-70 family)